jgi:hypothetical protein
VPVLQLAMQVELGERATAALQAGLVLAFDVDWELADGRRLRQSLALRFSPLLRSYQLALGGAPPQAFALRNSLLSAMENARLRFADAKACEGDCAGRVRVRLNPAALPAPLRLPALVDGDWDFDSGWKELESGAGGEGQGAQHAALDQIDSGLVPANLQNRFSQRDPSPRPLTPAPLFGSAP